jgi:hypothetical protein
MDDTGCEEFIIALLGFIWAKYVWWCHRYIFTSFGSFFILYACQHGITVNPKTLMTLNHKLIGGLFQPLNPNRSYYH